MITENNRLIDLHTHTDHSDGELSPEALLNKAQRYGLAAISITDHDTVSPYTSETRQHAEDVGVELVSGIEISTQDNDENPYHILGLLIDPSDKTLNEQLALMQEQRITYANVVCDLLGENLGITVDREALFESGGTVTKGNISRAVVTNEDNSDRLRKLFDGTIPTEGKFIESTMIKGKPCYVRKPNMTTPEQAVDLIHGAKGLAILAHPAFYVMKGEPLDDLCGKLVRWGGDGLEAINVQYDKSRGDREVDLTNEFRTFATSNKLVVTGGSDFHTDNPSFGRATDLGFRNKPEKGVNYTILDTLRERQASRFTKKR